MRSIMPELLRCCSISSIHSSMNSLLLALLPVDSKLIRLQTGKEVGLRPYFTFPFIRKVNVMGCMGKCLLLGIRSLNNT